MGKFSCSGRKCSVLPREALAQAGESAEGIVPDREKGEGRNFLTKVATYK
jgi:hypothetical protein